MPRRGRVPQEGLIRKDDIVNFYNSANKNFSSQEEITFASARDEKKPLVHSFAGPHRASLSAWRCAGRRRLWR